MGWLLRGRRDKDGAGGVDGRGGRHVNDLSPADVAERLRVLLDAIEAGQIEADLDHTAYLRGAADALALVADPPAVDQR